MRFGNLKISVRLGAAFAVLMALMLVMIVFSIVRFSSVGAANDQIIRPLQRRAQPAQFFKRAASAERHEGDHELQLCRLESGPKEN